MEPKSADKATMKSDNADKSRSDGRSVVPSKLTNSEEYKAMQASKEVKAAAPVVKEEPEKVRTEPIWPMDDEQLAQWKKDRAEGGKLSAARQKELDAWLESPARREEVRAAGALAGSLAADKTLAEHRRKSQSSEPKEEKAPKVKAEKPKKESRQKRLGQTKLIDELLKQGKSEAEVLETVKKQIPEYPADKLPKLIKLRQYHVKK